MSNNRTLISSDLCPLAPYQIYIFPLIIMFNGTNSNIYFGVHEDDLCCFTVSNGITVSERLLLKAFKESTHYGRFRFVFKIVLVLCDHF